MLCSCCVLCEGRSEECSEDVVFEGKSFRSAGRSELLTGISFAYVGLCICSLFILVFLKFEFLRVIDIYFWFVFVFRLSITAFHLFITDKG